MEQMLKQLLENQNQIIKTLQQHSTILEQHSTKLETLQLGQIKLEARMENEVIDKIRSLFDAREVQNERFDRIESKLDDLDDKIEYALLKLMRQEIKMQSKRKLP